MSKFRIVKYIIFAVSSFVIPAMFIVLFVFGRRAEDEGDAETGKRLEPCAKLQLRIDSLVRVTEYLNRELAAIPSHVTHEISLKGAPVLSTPVTITDQRPASVITVDAHGNEKSTAGPVSVNKDVVKSSYAEFDLMRKCTICDGVLSRMDTAGMKHKAYSKWSKKNSAESARLNLYLSDLKINCGRYARFVDKYKGLNSAARKAIDSTSGNGDYTILNNRLVKASGEFERRCSAISGTFRLLSEIAGENDTIWIVLPGKRGNNVSCCDAY